MAGFLVNPLPSTSEERSPETFSDCDDPAEFLPKKSKLAPGHRLLRLGLLAAIAMADSVPNVDLLTNKTLKRGLRRHRGNHGFLMTANLQRASIKQLRVILEASKVHLLRNDDYFELIMDTGCSKICTEHETDFIPGSLIDLAEPMSIDGIAGMLTSFKKGQVRYDVINDKGGLSVLECDAYFLPALKFRFLLDKSQRLVKYSVFPFPNYSVWKEGLATRGPNRRAV
jgi:hypothetical protein